MNVYDIFENYYGKTDIVCLCINIFHRFVNVVFFCLPFRPVEYDKKNNNNNNAR